MADKARAARVRARSASRQCALDAQVSKKKAKTIKASGDADILEYGTELEQVSSTLDTVRAVLKAERDARESLQAKLALVQRFARICWMEIPCDSEHEILEEDFLEDLETLVRMDIISQDDADNHNPDVILSRNPNIRV